MWGLSIRAVAVAAILLVTGCGGGGADGEGDPASLVPPDALVYAEAFVRPEGALRENALAAARKVLRSDDPAAEIRRALGADLDYDRDVKPWLGERAGFWTRGDDSALAILAATDTDKAMESVRAAFERDGQQITERSHGDVDYIVGSDGVAAGVVDEFAAIGREADLRRTIDVSDGESLAETDRYADAIDGLDDDRLAHFWADTRGLFELAAHEDAELDQLRSLVPLDDLPPVVGGFAADGERLVLEVRTRTVEGLGAAATPLVAELPGDAWLAGGTADLGASLRDSLDRFGGAIGGVAIRGQIRRELGLDLDRDLLDWIGHTAFFVRGTAPGTVDGGVVIQPTDERRAADAFGRILGAIQRGRGMTARPVDVAGADQAFLLRDGSRSLPIVFARGSGLVVLTVGVRAAEAALGSDDRLGESDTYAEAEELVDMEPSLLLSMPDVLELAGESADYAAARPYLEAFSVVAIGTVTDGEELVARVGAGLR